MYQFQGDLCSQSDLNSAVRKLPPELRSKRIFHITNIGTLNPDLTYFSNWLSNIAFVLDELLLQFSEKRISVKDKVTAKVSTSSLSANHSNSKTEYPVKQMNFIKYGTVTFSCH